MSLFPQLPNEIEVIILSFIADLESFDLYQLNTEKVVREIHLLVHRWSRIECWCRSKSVCRCIQRKLTPTRMKPRDYFGRRTCYYLGYGYRDLIMEWTRKIELEWLYLRCTKCSSGCPCQFRYPQRLRNGQQLIADECDKKFLKWETNGQVICWNDPEKQPQHCERCNNTRIIRLSGVCRSDIVE